MEKEFDNRPTTEKPTRMDLVFDSLSRLGTLSIQARTKANDIKARLIGEKPRADEEPEKAVEPSNHFDKLDNSISYISEIIRETNDILRDILKEI